MDIESALEFAGSNHRAVLAATRQDGGTQLTPVTVAVDDDGRVMISSRETAFKVKNLRARRRATVCVLSDGFFGEWVQLEGPVDIVSLPDAMDLLVEYYRRVSGEHPDWDDYRAAMTRDKRCVIRITPDRAGPTRSG
jgi:PPOX class probable F420-dependent enzyme